MDEKRILDARPRKQLSYLSVCCEVVERVELDAIAKAVEDHEIEMCCFMGDGGAVFGKAVDMDGLLHGLRDQGIMVVDKPMPKTFDDCMAYIQKKHSIESFSETTPEELKMGQALLKVWRWLHKHPSQKDHFRGGTPHLAAAQAISPMLPFHDNKANKTVEYWDEDALIWRPDGGQNMLKGESISEALNKVLQNVAFGKVWDEKCFKYRSVPLQDRQAVLKFEDGGFLSGVGGQLQGLKSRMPELNSLPGSEHMRMFTGGVLLDCSKPFDEQLSRGRQELRLSRLSPWQFVDWKDQLVNDGLSADEAAKAEAEVRCFCDDLKAYITKGGIDFDEAFGDRFRALMGRSSGVRETFFEFAGGRQDPESVHNCLYNMALFADAVSGLRIGMEEFAVMKGVTGSNGKGTVRTMLDRLLGNYNGASQVGYTCQFARGEVLQDFKRSTGPCEAMSNLQGCCIAWADELNTDMPVNSAVVRQLASFNDLDSDRKYGKKVGWTPWHLLVLLTNKDFVWSPPLGDMDFRRVTVLYHPVTFKDTDEFNPNNPNHRIKDRTKKTTGVQDHLPNVLCWFRALFDVSQCKKSGVMEPRPARVKEEIERLRPAMSGFDLAGMVREFMTSKLRPVNAGTTTTKGEKP